MSDNTFGAPKNLLLAGVVLALIILLNRQRNPYLRVASLVIAMAAGYALAWFMGMLPESNEPMKMCIRDRHTDIGHACVGARVDRQPYPLSQPLTSGQTVEIITAPGARPNAAWLNFVVSSKARAKIRQLLKNLKQMCIRDRM